MRVSVRINSVNSSALRVLENSSTRQGTISAFALLKLKYGGDEETRTPDPLLARQVLSQLSYTPK